MFSRGSFWLSLVGLLLNVPALFSNAADLDGGAQPILVSIVGDDLELSHRASFDLGALVVGQSVEVALKLHNLSGHRLTYDSVDAACSCTSFTPSSATVMPNESLDVKLVLETSGVPLSSKLGGVVTLLQNGVPACHLVFKYGANRYRGFGGETVLITADQHVSSQEFMVPIVIGNDVSDESLVVELKMKDVDFQYEIDREREVLNGSMNLSRLPESSSVFGEMRFLNGENHVRSRIPVIVQRNPAIRIRPSILRFVQEKAEGDFIAVAFLQSSEITDEPVIVSAQLETAAINTAIKRNDDLIKLTFRAPLSLVEKQFGSDARVALQFRQGSRKTDFKLLFVSREYSE